MSLITLSLLHERDNAPVIKPSTGDGGREDRGRGSKVTWKLSLGMRSTGHCLTDLATDDDQRMLIQERQRARVHASLHFYANFYEFLPGPEAKEGLDG